MRSQIQGLDGPHHTVLQQVAQASALPHPLLYAEPQDWSLSRSLLLKVHLVDVMCCSPTCNDKLETGKKEKTKKKETRKKYKPE